jgi:glyoxylase-like metal-dependent hydrolase (beta-lactamase superfamily II)/rhodanese-related sulfurtransferase
VIFEQVATGGCQSYLVGCPDTFVAALIDPEASQIDRYVGLAARHGLHVRYVIDTHTHADHFSASRQMAARLGAAYVMHRASPAPGVDIPVDDGDLLRVGNLRLKIMHTPGHTRDSMCLVGADRVWTGDTLLIGATGRTDLPSGDAEALHDSLFQRLLKVDPALLVYPAHDYKGRAHSTIEAELASNPRLQQPDRAAFVAMMQGLNLTMPKHLTEALRVNMTGGKSVQQMLNEAAATVPFMSLGELRDRLGSPSSHLRVLDVRERDAYEAGHVPGAVSLPRGQLELRINETLPDPTVRIVVCCEFGRISTLAASTLHTMGFQRAVALDDGLQAWREAGYPIRTGADP